MLGLCWLRIMKKPKDRRRRVDLYGPRLVESLVKPEVFLDLLVVNLGGIRLAGVLLCILIGQ